MDDVRPERLARGAWSSRAPLAARASLAILAAGASGCFTGTFAAGRPCNDDGDCGPELACMAGFCDGQLPEQDATTNATSDASSSTSTSGGSEGGTGTSSSTGDGTTGSPYLCEKVDVLLVLDNSRSMNQWDDNLFSLGYNFETYVGQLFSEVASYHFGVIATDAYDDNPEGCQVHGALALDTSLGLLCQSFEGQPYITEHDSFDANTLTCFVRIDGGSSDEKPVHSLLEATSPALNGPGGCNEGFLRDDALLVVLILTDENDDHGDEQGNLGSPGDPQFWYEKLLYHKRGNADAIVVGALLGEDPQTSSCPWMLPDDGNEDTMSTVPSIGAEEGVRIRSFLDKLPVGHAYVDSICGDSFLEFFDQFFNEIVQDACEDLDPAAIDPEITDPTEGDPSDSDSGTGDPTTGDNTTDGTSTTDPAPTSSGDATSDSGTTG